MAGSFRIAEGYVEVTADESPYERSMRRLQSAKNKVGIRLELDDRDAVARLDRFIRPRSLDVKVNLDQTALGRFALQSRTLDVLAQLQDGARRIAEAQLAELTKDRTVRIIADLDTRAAADDLALLTRTRTARILADADTRTAADDLALLTRPRNARVTADADTGDARARLDILTRDRRMNVRVDVDRSALSRLTGSLGGGGSGAGGIGALTSSLSSLTAMAIGALPTMASLGQAMIQMGPAAAIAAPAVLSLGAAFAAIKIGTSGIGDAFKAAFAPATKSAGAAESATRRVEAAQRSLAKAQQGVKDAEERAAEARVQAARQIEDAQRNLKTTVSDVADSNRRAAESVAQAERDLADAQRAARQAQLDLNDARKQAAQDLEDLNNRLADAQLDQRQKVLDLQDAEANLNAVKAKGSKATKEELDKAQLQYDRAVQALQEQQTETTRLQQQAADANKAGVEGSKKVSDAKQKIADANEQVTNKTRALKDAEIEQARTAQAGAQKIADAQRAVADAQTAAAKAAKDGARAIADAQQQAADAARALAEAQTSGAIATNKTADALSRLSPNARAFVDAVLAQRDAWRGLKLDVQDALFQGLGRTFTTLSTAVLPTLRAGLTGTASILNQTAKNAANAVIQLARTGTLRQMFDGLNAGMRPLTRIPGQIITGLTQISVAASPAFARLTAAAAGAADTISQKLGAAFKSGALADAINRGVEIAKQFGKVLGDAFVTVNNILKAAAQGGGDALGALGSVFAELRRITSMPEVQKALASIFQAINSIAKLVAGTLGAAIEAAMPLLAALAPVITQLADQLGPVLSQFLGQLGQALTPIITALLPVLTNIGSVIVGLVQAVMPLLQPIGDLLGAIVTAIAPVVKAVGDALVPLVATIAQGLAPVVQALVPVVGMFGQLLGALAPLFPPLLQALMPLMQPLAQLTVSLLNLAMQVITPLMPLIVGLAQLLTTVLAGAINILVPVITTVIGWLTTFTDAVTKVVHWIVEGFQWLYDTLVGHSIIPDLVKAIVQWFTSLWTKTKQLFTDLKNWVVDTWHKLWDGVRSKWDSFWSGLKSGISTAWGWVKSSVSQLKTGITDTWNSLWGGVRDKVAGIFSTISGKVTSFKNSMKTAFSTLRDALGTIWNGVKSKIASPIKFVIGTVYNDGIRRMWNSIAGKISSKITLPYIGLGFNSGGIVPGTGNTDTVPAMLTPGERILSKQQVAALGGHRGIDAILGKDRPTKTGGNPSNQQERRRQQASQHFGSGGIVGAIGGAIGSAASWVKDVVVGGLRDAAGKALSSLVRPLINSIPQSGIGSLMRGLVNKGVDGMLSWFTNEDKKAVGGPAVQRALAWAKTQVGLPYQWAGNGNPSWDCSGFMSAIESVIRGERPHRRWATGAFPPGTSGWVRNLQSPFMIGITNAGVGHTAGTLAGINFESSGGRGVHMGKGARGYNDPLFTSQWGFAPATKYDGGGLLQPGATMAVNATGRPERILDAQQTAQFEALLRGGAGVTIQAINISGTFDFSSPASRRAAANALVAEMKEAIRKSDRSRA
ncbi:hypothetical protein ACH4UM_23935 [Streptomyces sp. NPDC020801]|uniref:hypothetical protein n=1 Tax=Streptomyces sp. NPDC020801 TaxID=3365093 RepID=UPI0037B9144D